LDSTGPSCFTEWNKSQ